MSIRWRLLVTTLQLLVLVIATAATTGLPYSGATWFAAGLFAVVINPKLLEPFYSKPADVIGNSAISLLLYLTTTRRVAWPGWDFLAISLLLALVCAIVASVFGTGKSNDRLESVAWAATAIAREFTALRIYSAVFWLALLEAFPQLGSRFWKMGIGWAAIVMIGSVNWERLWSVLTGAPTNCVVDGMIGPSQLLVSAPSLPQKGSHVVLRSDTTTAQGVVLARIRRTSDVWGRIHLADQHTCETLLQSGGMHLTCTDPFDLPVVGSVEATSTDAELCFYPTESLRLGSVIQVEDSSTDILYQVNSAEVKQVDVKGGAHLQVRAYATQLGTFNPQELCLRRHGWVPRPGAAVCRGSQQLGVELSQPPLSWLCLGHVLGTDIPVFLDMEAAAEGHVAVLGMTRMGKSCLAHRMASFLAAERIVTVLDQTGEYANKRRIDAYSGDHDAGEPGIAVYELRPGEVAADRALAYLERIMQISRREYETGTPTPRAILIDEAHQFVPEPAILGYGAPGRDSAVKFGLYMMQIRKYGITVVLVSQRTAVVAKSALSQCENLIVFRSVDQTGLHYLEAIAGRGVREMLPRLKQGEALVFGPAMSSDNPVAIEILYQPGGPQSSAEATGQESIQTATYHGSNPGHSEAKESGNPRLDPTQQ